MKKVHIFTSILINAFERSTCLTGRQASRLIWGCILTLVALVFMPQFALAQSTLHIFPSEVHERSETYGPGEEIEARVEINTHGATIGVGEGTLSFSSEDLRVKNVSREGSIFSLWVEEPRISGNTVTFVGGVPGGFSGVGDIFTLTFEVKAPDTTHVILDSVRVLSFAAEPKETVRRVTGAWYPFEIPRFIPKEYTFENLLEEGNRNRDVAYLQLCLVSEGHLAEEFVTGIFDSATKEALILFQGAVGLLDSGIVGSTTNEALNQNCQKSALPARLFDINLEIDDPVVEDIRDLLARVIFTSFGQVPTEVELSFFIVDEEGQEIYRENDFVVVETEYILSKTFENIFLLPGNYTLVLETLYNEDVFDEFRSSFEITGEKRGGIPAWVWWLLALLAIIIAAFLNARVRHWLMLPINWILLLFWADDDDDEEDEEDEDYGDERHR